MRELHAFLLRPLLQTFPGQAVVRVSDDDLDVFGARLVRLAIRQQRVSQVPVRGLDVGIDFNGALEPFFCLVHALCLEVNVTGEKRGEVLFRIEDQRAAVSGKGSIEVTSREGPLAFAHEVIHFLAIREGTDHPVRR